MSVFHFVHSYMIGLFNVNLYMTRFDMLHLWYGVWILWLFRFQPGWLFSQAYPARQIFRSLYAKRREFLPCRVQWLSNTYEHGSVYLYGLLFCHASGTSTDLFNWFDSQHRSGIVSRLLFSFEVCWQVEWGTLHESLRIPLPTRQFFLSCFNYEEEEMKWRKLTSVSYDSKSSVLWTSHHITL